MQENITDFFLLPVPFSDTLDVLYLDDSLTSPTQCDDVALAHLREYRVVGLEV